MVRTLEGRRQAVKVVADVAGLAEQHAVVAAPVLADLAYCVCAHMPVQKNSSSSRSQRSTCITRQRSGIVDRRRGGGEAAQPARSRGAGLSPQLARNEPRSPCHQGQPGPGQPGCTKRRRCRNKCAATYSVAAPSVAAGGGITSLLQRFSTRFRRRAAFAASSEDERKLSQRI